MRFAHSQFLIAFVNGGHWQGQIQGKLYLHFFACAFGALDVFAVVLRGKRAKNDRSRASADFQLSSAV